MDKKLGKLLTTTEVARMLGVTSAAVSQWLLDGDFPDAFKLNPGRINSAWRIPQNNVEAFLKKRREQRGFVRVAPEIKRSGVAA